MVPTTFIETLFTACHSSSYDQLEAKVRELLVEGYSVSQMLLQLHDMLVPMTTITDAQKSVIAERMGVSQATSSVHLTECGYLLADCGPQVNGWCG